ncbi:MAG TPA: adenylosuccinate synthase [Anaerovoracaceae bacterium]|nr:adenylosuccinate synthase [Anaerovoracaceae bacterium]
MPGLIVVGLQFGDEGKGKVVDYYAENADMVVRYAGGANAGHTLVVNGKKTILRLIPSGILNPNAVCVMAQGMAIDPLVLASEIKALREADIKVDGRLFLSDKASLIMPYHLEIDQLRERGSNKLGTTKKGIGPTYEDKVSRRGLRLEALRDIDKAWDQLWNSFYYWTTAYKGQLNNPLMSTQRMYMSEAADALLPFLTDTTTMVNAALKNRQNVLFEGAQGTMLDIDHGTYPYVTSSSAIAGGACTGAGVGPTRINKVIGITKAYTTRVGEGPFDTELTDELADQIRTKGHEFGSVTGRPRRVGWLDLLDLKYACMVNGTTALAITKLDILSGLPSILICNNKGIGTDFKTDETQDVRTYETLPGWEEDLTHAKKFSDLPKNAQRYVEYIESFLETPVCLISVGADRNNTIITRDAFV